MKSEIAAFSEHGASHITQHTMERLLHQLPMLKAEFTQIDDPKHPHLVDQLEFLADAVEDAADDAYTHLPYHALAAAAFALIYAHQAIDIIPDYVKDIGHADDSAVVRYVLMRYERNFRAYAKTREIDFDRIVTTRA